MGQQRRKYTDDYKAAAVERLYEPGATQGPDAALQALSEELSKRGIDLAEMSNDEVAAALDPNDARILYQDNLSVAVQKDTYI
jgi:transposase-like protein